MQSKNMKKIYLLLIAIMAMSGTCGAATCPDGHGVRGCRSESHFGDCRRDGHACHAPGDARYCPSYIISNGKVYFGGHVVEGASASGFTVLDDGYARDPWGVYYWGQKIADASSQSFKTLGYGYAADAWKVYYCGAVVDGASPSSFTVMADGYAKDNWNEYFDGKKIDGASAGSFEVLGEGYARDTWNTYYYGHRISD